jgi:hypothetical protein
LLVKGPGLSVRFTEQSYKADPGSRSVF